MINPKIGETVWLVIIKNGPLSVHFDVVERVITGDAGDGNFYIRTTTDQPVPFRNKKDMFATRADALQEAIKRVEALL